MNKVFCPKCDSEMEMLFQGNVNCNLQKKDSKGRWNPVPQVPLYKKVFRCPIAKCNLQLVFEHRSKASVNFRIKSRFQKRRLSRIVEDKRKRLLREEAARMKKGKSCDSTNMETSQST